MDKVPTYFWDAAEHLETKVEENLNLQNKRGEAITYQVRQFLKLVEEYSLTMEDE
jgi:hypothetical protein